MSKNPSNLETISGKKLVPQLAKLADANDKAFLQSPPPKKRQEFLDTIQGLLAANEIY